MMKNPIRSIRTLTGGICAFAWLCIFLPDARSAQPPLLIHYSFDDTDGAGSVRDGGDHGYGARFLLPDNATGPVPSVPGVVGSALDLGAASGMGHPGVGPKLQMVAPRGRSPGMLTSFTILVWVRAAAPPGGNAQLVSTLHTIDPLTLGFPENQPAVYFRLGEDLAMFRLTELLEPNAWYLLAVVYDSSRTDEEVSLYVGRQSDGAVELIGTKSMPHGPWNTDAVGGIWCLALGNTTLPENHRPFRGQIDEFRLFGSGDDASAALSLEQIEELFSKGKER